jgi:hypothetical protein
VSHKTVVSGMGVAYQKRRDTVGELTSVEICVSHMPSLKAKKLGKLAQEKSTSRTLK